MTEDAAQELQASVAERDFDVGARLRRLRQERGLSQRELARRAGMTNANLSMIEQGRVSPSVATLERILTALPMSLGDFFQADLNSTPVVYSPAAQELIRYEGCDCYLVLGQNAGMPSVAQLVLAPGGMFRGETLPLAPGWISGVVQAGELKLYVGDAAHLVKKGDMFQFYSRRGYRVENPSPHEGSLVITSFSYDPNTQVHS
ncbi:helix-turn-helix domain-containing protein [Saccharophagus sp. K07]|uniref:helix-turn-helix domain-containing protein n=1 Tax=Saccharophagus sp. K07 TaxID=2283636 RepID=UPI0016524BD1|nr:helix-turn-helix domain-containing protein [Saccharophagus sp. K07]